MFCSPYNVTAMFRWFPYSNRLTNSRLWTIKIKIFTCPTHFCSYTNIKDTF